MPRKAVIPKATDDLRVVRITSLSEFDWYRDGLTRLMQQFTSTMADDSNRPSPASLTENLTSTVPYLWLVINSAGQVLVGGSLNDIVPGRCGWIHGVSDPHVRKHPALSATILAILTTAFDELGLPKVKAEVTANNAGAKGFCLRLGFTKEAHYRDELMISGQPTDVLVYSLFRQTFSQTTRRILAHVIRKKEEQKQ